MFQAELGYMMRKEQHKDFVRQAERAQHESTAAHSDGVSGIAYILLIVPLALVTLVSRASAFYSHTIGHTL